jgi:FtsP/CotA-like multicopper oxidase with cupredoxin domain
VHFEEHAGRTLYHCHMTEHSDKGMMAVIQVD